MVELLDYQMQVGKNLKDGSNWEIKLPKSNVLQFVLEDGSKISARPSGTEPKIKFYFSVNLAIESLDEIPQAESVLDAKIATIIKEMHLN